MGVLVKAWIIKRDGTTLPLEVTPTSVRLSAPVESTDHLLYTLDDGSYYLLDPPTHRGDRITFNTRPSRGVTRGGLLTVWLWLVGLLAGGCFPPHRWPG